MKKTIGVICVLGLLAYFLVLSTPVTRLGSGFLISDSPYVFSYYDLVKDAQKIVVRFPNEDDIPASIVHKNSNLVILKLEESPKVKRQLLNFSPANHLLHDKYVFTLGYPWTNTMEDRHNLIEGTLQLESATPLYKVDMPLDPIHHGGPLFNNERQVVGMLVSGRNSESNSPADPAKNYAIPFSILLETLKAGKLTWQEHGRNENDSMEQFREAVKNNIVLVEAR